MFQNNYYYDKIHIFKRVYMYRYIYLMKFLKNTNPERAYPAELIKVAGTTCIL